VSSILKSERKWIMHITIIGASAGVGFLAAERALARGWHVTALARRTPMLAGPSDRLTRIVADATDPDAVAGAIAGRDAVLVTLGRPPLDGSRLRARGTEAVLTAMARTGVRRLVCLSGLGAGDSGPALPFRYRRVLLPTLLRRVYADHAAQEEAVMASDIDWTLVRPANLTDAPAEGRFAEGFKTFDPAYSYRISRADVADFMLREVSAPRYVRACPSLSGLREGCAARSPAVAA
jgi:putative NADH-flavin reductase